MHEVAVRRVADEVGGNVAARFAGGVGAVPAALDLHERVAARKDDSLDGGAAPAGNLAAEALAVLRVDAGRFVGRAVDHFGIGGDGDGLGAFLGVEGRVVAAGRDGASAWR